MSYVYALMDPFTMEIRYVGQSVNPQSRFRAHITSKHSGKVAERWIRGCLIRGRKPILAILDLVRQEEVDNREKLWIKYCEGQGCRLTNQWHCRQTRGTHSRNRLGSEQQYRCRWTIEGVTRSSHKMIAALALRQFDFWRCLRIRDGAEVAPS